MNSTLRQLPPGIWALGFVSLLADVSSEMVHALLPLFMLSLGASATTEKEVPMMGDGPVGSEAAHVVLDVR